MIALIIVIFIATSIEMYINRRHSNQQQKELHTKLDALLTNALSQQLYLRLSCTSDKKLTETFKHLIKGQEGIIKVTDEILKNIKKQDYTKPKE